MTFGAFGDSFYEYLLKVWMQGGRREDRYRKMYDDAMDGVDELLVQKVRGTKTCSNPFTKLSTYVPNKLQPPDVFIPINALVDKQQGCT